MLYEGPIPQRDLEGYRKLREKIVKPIATHADVPPLQIALREESCDGFVLSPTHMPGAYEDFVRLVVPELQRRGLFQKEYQGSTLRENLGLLVPKSGDWKTMYGPDMRSPSASAAQ